MRSHWPRLVPSRAPGGFISSRSEQRPTGERGAMNSARWLRVLETLLLAAGFFFLGWWFHGWNESRAFQHSAMESLEQRREAFASLERPESTASKPGTSAPAKKAARKRHAIADRSVIGRIDIPRLKISAVIVEGTEPDVLDKAVGHFATTALPGEPGNVALAGHRDTFLRGLGAIRPDDEVLIS